MKHKNVFIETHVVLISENTSRKRYRYTFFIRASKLIASSSGVILRPRNIKVISPGGLFDDEPTDLRMDKESDTSWTAV
jgi:hypothetical protein